MDGDTQMVFQRIANKMGWTEEGGLEMAEEELLRSISKTRLVTCQTQPQDLRFPVRLLLLDSADDTFAKENQRNQASNANVMDYRDKVQIESSEDDFDQFLMQNATPKADLRKPRSAPKKESVYVAVVVSSDCEDSFDAFLNRVKTPKAKPKTTAKNQGEDGLKNVIVDYFSSDDDFIIEKKKPSTCKVYKTPKANISQPPVRKPLTECDSPVFLSDSDDDSLVSKSTWRSRHPPCHPSSRTKTVNILESNLEDISPSSSQSSSPFLPSFRAPTPSFPSSLFLAQPQQTHSASPRRTYSAPSKLEDSVSSEEEFLSLLDRVRKNSMLGSNTPTPKNNTGSSHRLHAPTPTTTPSVSKPSTKGQKKAGPRPGGRMPMHMKTSVPPQPAVTQTEPRPSTFTTRLGMCRTPGCFLQSLSTYACGFKLIKENLTARLFQLYNTSVFESKLPAGMSVSWNKKMRKTAGYCITGQERVGGNRYARIELSEKVCDSADRLRDTLVHEMCHAATWLINGVRDGHGPFWKLYASKATLVHPELPMVTRCHSYDINYKYKYQCSHCKNTIGRHSKSLDTQRFICALCTGPLVLLVSANSKPRAPTPFASFVKENYGSMRQELTGQSHANVMRKLSANFATKTRLSQS
ncbi:acidic repeat-containing protein isoform X1 [Hypomesus transpacificus]|uniref:acidic repeat-containing protein isoform X1 n=1 Tax=Hypomesus transpacificus TaxID=137520 RepID=UPI001F085EE9|nr:acidic repeat-containing protein isoform X1 [Hypomesus transpacificus]